MVFLLPNLSEDRFLILITWIFRPVIGVSPEESTYDVTKPEHCLNHSRLPVLGLNPVIFIRNCDESRRRVGDVRRIQRCSSRMWVRKEENLNIFEFLYVLGNFVYLRTIIQSTGEGCVRDQKEAEILLICSKWSNIFNSCPQIHINVNLLQLVIWWYF